MKLWKKIVILVLAVQVLSFAGFGQVLLRHLEKKQFRAVLETRKEHMDNVAALLENMAQDSDDEGMTAITKRSMAALFLKKYDLKDYAIAKPDEVLASACAYAITPYSGWYERENGKIFYTEQGLNGKNFLILSENITLWKEKYALYGVREITSLYEGLRKLTFRLLMAGCAILLVTCLLLFFSVKKLLSPLNRLAQTAQAIQRGDYGARNGDLAKKGDEIGTVADAFDAMACEVEQKITQMEEAGKRQEQLFSALSHELKTPVTSLIGYSDTLLHVKLSDMQKEKALGRIYEESKRLERLSAKLMSLIGLYENDAIKKEPVPIGTLMEEVRQAVGHSLEEKRMEAQFFWEEFTFEMDLDLMESLLINLIDNSKKASMPGSSIEVTAKWGEIAVRDFGCGICEEELEKVKEPFYMVDKARKKQEGSIGLGLSLCVRIAEAHGGELKLESRPGEGTKASFCWEGENTQHITK